MNALVILIVWSVICICGGCAAFLSLRLMTLITISVITAHEPIEVVRGSYHLQRDQLLLFLTWIILLGVGIAALVDWHAQVGVAIAAEPQVAWRQAETWALVAAVAILAYKTVVDYLYTREVWGDRDPQRCPLSAAAEAVGEKVAEARASHE